MEEWANNCVCLDGCVGGQDNLLGWRGVKEDEIERMYRKDVRESV